MDGEVCESIHHCFSTYYKTHTITALVEDTKYCDLYIALAYSLWYESNTPHYSGGLGFEKGGCEAEGGRRVSGLS